MSSPPLLIGKEPYFPPNLSSRDFKNLFPQGKTIVVTEEATPFATLEKVFFPFNILDTIADATTDDLASLMIDKIINN